MLNSEYKDYIRSFTICGTTYHILADNDYILDTMSKKHATLRVFNEDCQIVAKYPFTVEILGYDWGYYSPITLLSKYVEECLRKDRKCELLYLVQVIQGKSGIELVMCDYNKNPVTLDIEYDEEGEIS